MRWMIKFIILVGVKIIKDHEVKSFLHNSLTGFGGNMKKEFKKNIVKGWLLEMEYQKSKTQ